MATSILWFTVRKIPKYPLITMDIFQYKTLDSIDKTKTNASYCEAGQKMWPRFSCKNIINGNITIVEPLDVRLDRSLESGGTRFRNQVKRLLKGCRNKSIAQRRPNRNVDPDTNQGPRGKSWPSRLRPIGYYISPQ